MPPTLHCNSSTAWCSWSHLYHWQLSLPHPVAVSILWIFDVDLMLIRRWTLPIHCRTVPCCTWCYTEHFNLFLCYCLVISFNNNVATFIITFTRMNYYRLLCTVYSTILLYFFFVIYVYVHNYGLVTSSSHLLTHCCMYLIFAEYNIVCPMCMRFTVLWQASCWWLQDSVYQPHLVYCIIIMHCVIMWTHLWTKCHMWHWPVLPP